MVQFSNTLQPAIGPGEIPDSMPGGLRSVDQKGGWNAAACSRDRWQFRNPIILKIAVQVLIQLYNKQTTPALDFAEIHSGRSHSTADFASDG